jgi:tetratricopeptide (TPR) repeat protein
MLNGQAQALTKHFDEASVNLYSAVQADASNLRYLTALAWLKQLQGLHDQALCILRNAQDLDTESPYIAYRIAISYFLTGKAGQSRRGMYERYSILPGLRSTLFSTRDDSP